MVPGAVVPRPRGSSAARPARPGACSIPSGPTAPGTCSTARRTATSTPPSRPMRRCVRSAIATTKSRCARRATGFCPRAASRNIRVFTRYWLALIGEWPWEKTPNIPPEVIWLPTWFPFSIYNFAQWARATLMPIAVLSAHRPSRPLPPESRLDALFPQGRDSFNYDLPARLGAGVWDVIFRKIDTVLHRAAGLGRQARRRTASCAAARSVTCWNGSSAIRTMTAAGAASSRPGSTA